MDSGIQKDYGQAAVRSHFKRRARSRRNGVRTASSGMGCHACKSLAFATRPAFISWFRECGRAFFVCATAHVNRDSNTNMPFRPFFYLAPGPGYDVFMKVHVAYQTCLNFFSRCRADLKATSQRPVGLEAEKKPVILCPVNFYLTQNPLLIGTTPRSTGR